MFELVVAIEFGNGKILFSNDHWAIYDIDAINDFANTLGYRLYNNDKFIVLYHERNDIKCIKIFKGVKLK